jgi:hypothetical protein
MQYTAMKRDGTAVTFNSDLTDREVLAILAGMTGSQFAQDLAAKFNTLSANQWAWAHKLAVDSTRPAPAPLAVSLSGVIDLFDTAVQHLKRPAIVAEGIRLSRCGARSAYTGAVNVTSAEGDYDGRTWYGRIERDGTLRSGRDMTDAVRALLERLAADPAGFAAAHGRLTGNCCFCRKALTDERSTAVGYGPVCADHFGLPWGTVPAAATV